MILQLSIVFVTTSLQLFEMMLEYRCDYRQTKSVGQANVVLGGEAGESKINGETTPMA
jgi:hypothetical protein